MNGNGSHVLNSSWRGRHTCSIRISRRNHNKTYRHLNTHVSATTPTSSTLDGIQYYSQTMDYRTPYPSPTRLPRDPASSLELPPSSIENRVHPSPTNGPYHYPQHPTSNEGYCYDLGLASAFRPSQQSNENDPLFWQACYRDEDGNLVERKVIQSQVPGPIGYAPLPRGFPRGEISFQQYGNVAGCVHPPDVPCPLNREGCFPRKTYQNIHQQTEANTARHRIPSYGPPLPFSTEIHPLQAIENILRYPQQQHNTGMKRKAETLGDLGSMEKRVRWDDMEGSQGGIGFVRVKPKRSRSILWSSFWGWEGEANDGCRSGVYGRDGRDGRESK